MGYRPQDEQEIDQEGRISRDSNRRKPVAGEGDLHRVSNDVSPLSRRRKSGAEAVGQSHRPSRKSSITRSYCLFFLSMDSCSSSLVARAYSGKGSDLLASSMSGNSMSTS